MPPINFRDLPDFQKLNLNQDVANAISQQMFPPLYGISTDNSGAGVEGDNNGAGWGVLGQSLHGVGVLARGGRLAGRFEGDVEVTGDIRLVNGDCAEYFDVASEGPVEPGTVMTLDDSGGLQHSGQAYDKRVAGVIAGAGGYKPAILLDNGTSVEGRRYPIALLGKVYCKVDAQYASVRVGDLLTTSPTSGHAMKATDPSKSTGSIIGKALGSLDEGTGLIPILVALQ